MTLKDILLITSPFTQLNTPYPATAYLKGFLNTKEISSYQVDLGIEVILEIFNKDGLDHLFNHAVELNAISSENAKRIVGLRKYYVQLIDEVILFLQGRNQTLARQICSGYYLPQASRFQQLDDLDWAFGTMGIQDKAKFLATLFIEDIADFITECVDPYFGFSRYAERLGMSANSFDEIHERLSAATTYINKITLNLLDEKIKVTQPKLVCFSVPFPGNLYSAFACAQYIKKYYPAVKTAMGGGFPNTELRSISDIRVFDYFDFITLDDGELPIEILSSNIDQPNSTNPDFNLFKRTFLLEEGKVVYNNFSLRKDYAQDKIGTPDYSDLRLDEYISVIEIANPMHSLWTDGRWNKLTMAHGCYWGKCTFCDISLDYIQRYEPIAAGILVDRMEEIINQTGERGFHFVDEAAPPALMRSLAIEILRRKLNVSWWTNIRFEKSFTYDLCRLLQASGCIAVSGGLEVASNRLLKLIDKGVSVEQVARVADNFTSAGMMVHAYLMYAYPTQTVQETIDSLEMVRQLFELNVLQSGFWHQFAMTAHSPVGQDPTAYGIIPDAVDVSFAHNDIPFTDSTGIDHNQFSFGLKKSLFNYMHGECFDFELQDWFDFEIPETTIDTNFIERCLTEDTDQRIKPSSKILWLGSQPSHSLENNQLNLTLYNQKENLEVLLDQKNGYWILDALVELSKDANRWKTYQQLEESYVEVGPNFDEFWQGPEMSLLRTFGLLVL